MSDPVKWERSHYTCIEAGKRSLAADIREVAAYRDLIGMFVKREFVVKYKQTVLGPLWLILRPFITSLFHLFLFSGIAHIETGGVPGILFYIGSNAVWNYFAMTLTSNAGMFRDNAALFGKVYFPRLTVPVSNVLIAALQYGIEMMLFLIFYVWFFVRGEVAGSLAALAVIPAVLIHLGLLGLSCGIILSSLTTKYRDLSVLIQFGVQLWMYASPVVYPLAGIENRIKCRVGMTAQEAAGQRLIFIALVIRRKLSLSLYEIFFVIFKQLRLLFRHKKSRIITLRGFAPDNAKTRREELFNDYINRDFFTFCNPRKRRTVYKTASATADALTYGDFR